MDQIAEHGVTPEDVFTAPRRRGLDAHDTPTERRWAIIRAPIPTFVNPVSRPGY
jgi:hypothetical protein